MRQPHGGLRHLVWFEFIGNQDDDSELRRIVEPAFFLIRLLDHYILAGPVMITPESVSVASIRRGLDAMPAGHPDRKLILAALSSLAQCLDDDVRPALPAFRAYADVLSREPWGQALARDVIATLDEYAQ